MCLTQIGPWIPVEITIQTHRNQTKSYYSHRNHRLELYDNFQHPSFRDLPNNDAFGYSLQLGLLNSLKNLDLTQLPCSNISLKWWIKPTFSHHKIPVLGVSNYLWKINHISKNAVRKKHKFAFIGSNQHQIFFVQANGRYRSNVYLSTLLEVYIHFI